MTGELARSGHLEKQDRPNPRPVSDLGRGNIKNVTAHEEGIAYLPPTAVRAPARVGLSILELMARHVTALGIPPLSLPGRDVPAPLDEAILLMNQLFYLLSQKTTGAVVCKFRTFRNKTLTNFLDPGKLRDPTGNHCRLCFGDGLQLG